MSDQSGRGTSAFQADHERDMQDPEYRLTYEAATLAIAVHALIAEHGAEAVTLEVERQTHTHGSIAAARWHQSRGEPMCDECKDGWAAYYRERRKTAPARGLS